jgi:MOSC domain-containing protein YiiM
LHQNESSSSFFNILNVKTFKEVKINSTESRGICNMQDRSIEIINFAIGLPKTMPYGNQKEMETGICKNKTEEAFLTKEGFCGDGVANLKYHGGPDRAICIYPHEHYRLWEQEFDISLPPSAFGENLTVTNMLERDVCIGDVYQLGEAVIQVTQGRIPCSTITRRMNVQGLLKRIAETGYTGYFCRVLKEGTVRHHSNIQLMKRHPQQVSILFANEIYFHRQTDVEGIKKVLEVQELANQWRESLAGRFNQWITSV